MERIKDISKMKLQLGSVLIKIKLKGGIILAPEGNTPKPMVDYAEVVALSKDITDLSIGDIVLDFRTAEGFDWKNDKYAVIPRMNVKVAVDKEDFDFGIKVDKRKLN